MRTFRIFITVACLGFGAMLTEAFITLKNNDSFKPSNADKGFAVVEFFTSEGCSSCPPADALVAKVEKESADKPIYILAFHVDYWNRLGWKDVFSGADYTARQQQYARWLKSSEVYTPQAIVNGHTEFVGSEEGTLRKAIQAGLQKTAATPLALSEDKTGGNKAGIQYHISGSTTNASLLVALIKKNATTKVQRGENGGRTLTHVQIVNKLQTITLDGKNNGKADIALPAGFNPEGFEVIAFVQDTSTGEITGASKIELTASTANSK
ncbi:MAG: DUF1223 domain-containing protein [Sphingobacteriales bacterium]